MSTHQKQINKPIILFYKWLCHTFQSLISLFTSFNDKYASSLIDSLLKVYKRLIILLQQHLMDIQNIDTIIILLWQKKSQMCGVIRVWAERASFLKKQSKLSSTSPIWFTNFIHVHSTLLCPSNLFLHLKCCLFLSTLFELFIVEFPRNFNIQQLQFLVTQISSNQNFQ